MRPFSDTGNKHRFTLSGDWWYFAGALKVLILRQGMPLIDGQDGEGWTITVPTLPQDTALINGADNKTVITITQRNSETTAFWMDLKVQLEEMAAIAREMRRDVYGPTGEEVIEIYYRARAVRGKRVTLKQLAEQYGFNVTYLSQAKRLYDAAGKWGSKTKIGPK